MVCNDRDSTKSYSFVRARMGLKFNFLGTNKESVNALIKIALPNPDGL